ncbi:MAG: alpha-glucuronidase, partial [Sulfobacillus thermosulfidooxidans]
TFGTDPVVGQTITTMLMASGEIYESYTAPLGVGWMVNPGHHYGPNVDGYEYSHWGTYHYADIHGIGVDRTRATGTGYVEQYQQPWQNIFESCETCPDSLLLFFHHVPYTHRLHSGKTVIQHIYDTHFEGAARVDELISQWERLQDRLDLAIWHRVRQRLDQQRRNAQEWCDVVTTYFWRKSGIPDRHNRLHY